MKHIKAIILSIVLITSLMTVQQSAQAHPSTCTTLASISAIDSHLRWTVASYSCLIAGFDIVEVNCVPGFNCGGGGILPANGYGPYDIQLSFGPTTLVILSEVLPNDARNELARIKPLQSRVRLPIVLH